MSEIITEITEQKKRKNRYNLYTEDGFFMSLSDETLYKYNLKPGAELSGELIKELREYDTLKYANELSIAYISYKPRTAKKLKEHLLKKGIDEESALSSIEIMRQYNYIDDESFARAYAAEYLKKYSPKMVKMRLINEGVAADTANDVLEEFSDENDETLKNTFDTLCKKYSTPPEKQKQRVYQAMIRKGYSYYDFSDLLSTLDAD